MARHILKLSYRSGNNRRMGHGLPITERQATDPVARANLISQESALIEARGWRLLNWSIEEAS